MSIEVSVTPGDYIKLDMPLGGLPSNPMARVVAKVDDVVELDEKRHSQFTSEDGDDTVIYYSVTEVLYNNSDYPENEFYTTDWSPVGASYPGLTRARTGKAQGTQSSARTHDSQSTPSDRDRTASSDDTDEESESEADEEREFDYKTIDIRYLHTSGQWKHHQFTNVVSVNTAGTLSEDKPYHTLIGHRPYAADDRLERVVRVERADEEKLSDGQLPRPNGHDYEGNPTMAQIYAHEAGFDVNVHDPEAK